MLASKVASISTAPSPTTTTITSTLEIELVLDDRAVELAGQHLVGGALRREHVQRIGDLRRIEAILPEVTLHLLERAGDLELGLHAQEPRHRIGRQLRSQMRGELGELELGGRNAQHERRHSAATVG